LTGNFFKKILFFWKARLRISQIRNGNRDFYCIKIWRLTSSTRRLVKTFFTFLAKQFFIRLSESFVLIISK
jgi:hypothetical protein